MVSDRDVCGRPTITNFNEHGDRQTHLQMALTAAQMATWQWVPETDAFSQSDNLAQLYGLPLEDALKTRTDALGLIHSEDYERHQATVMNTVEHGGTYTSQFRITRPDNGRTIWLEERGQAQCGSGGKTVRLVGVVMDITDRMQASESLRQRVEEIQTLLDTLPIGVFIAHDPDSLKITGNQAAYELLRSPASRNLSLTAPSDERPDNFRVCQNGVELKPDQLPVQRAARGETIRDAELDVVFEDGNVIHELVSASPLFDSHGRVRGAVASVLNATDHKRSQEWLAGQKHILEMVARDTALVDVLHALCELIEAHEPSVHCSLLVTETQSNVIGYAVAPSFSQDYMRGFLGLKVEPPFPGPCFQAIATNEIVSVHDIASDGRFDATLRKDLSELGFRACKSYPVLAVDSKSRASLCLYSAEPGEPRLSNEGWIEAVMQLIEISIQRHSTQALKHSESLFRTLSETLPDLLWIADSEGRPIYQNPAWRTYTGMSQEDLIRNGWECMVHPDDLEQMRAIWQRAAETLEPFTVEYRCRRYDEAYRWCFAKTVPLKDEAGKLLQWIGTATDIHDRKHAEDALRESDRKKDEFLATLAHELRNPLAPIQNGLQIIKMVPNDAALIEQAREMMERQLFQLIRLIDDLMDLTRISRGKINLRRTRIDIAAPVRSAIESSRSLIETAGHKLQVRLPAEPAFLVADEIRVAQIITNLLNNAAKYTSQGGRIDLSVDVTTDEVGIAVEDNGVGIPPEMLPRIFDIFTQVDSSLERAQGGLGIGLSIVKKLVEMHQGRTEAYSDGVGRGSRFVVWLPLDKSSTSPVVANENSSLDTAPPSLKVLVVDDNRDSALSISALLKMLGNRTEVAHDGLAAVASAESFRPDIILLDIGLPLLNGYDVCRRIRAQPWGMEMTIVACTGWGQEEDKKAAHAAGCNAHVTKPIELTALKRILSEKGSGLFSRERP